jgi:hypothetical protein
MTTEELQQWLTKAKLMDGESEFDENGNCEAIPHLRA